jgi:antitoxin component YwqK of YwqJK toxin-antitoxin module
MNKLSVIMFFLSLIMIGCTENRVLISELEYVGGEENYNKGLWYNQGEPFSGVAFEMYNVSQLKEETYFKDGKKDGLHKYYYRDGGLQTEGTYKDGLRDGLWTEYDRSGEGSIWSQKTYENGIVVAIHIESRIITN